MKRIMSFLLLCCISLAFVACSGKVQTNKIPNDKKYSLPKTLNFKKPKVDDYIKHDFDVFVSEFFQQEKKQELKKNLYYIGIQRGHFNENK